MDVTSYFQFYGIQNNNKIVIFHQDNIKISFNIKNTNIIYLKKSLWFYKPCIVLVRGQKRYEFQEETDLFD